jgi:hypothetical protein
MLGGKNPQQGGLSEKRHAMRAQSRRRVLEQLPEEFRTQFDGMVWEIWQDGFLYGSETVGQNMDTNTLLRHWKRMRRRLSGLTYSEINDLESYNGYTTDQ